MASCLVLGGAGFIGSHLAEVLLQAGHRVRIFDRPHLDRLPSFLQRREFEVFTGDFLNPYVLSAALEGSEIVFHLVSTTLPKTSNDNPVYDVESNVVGTLRLLELCRSQGVRKVVFVSSGGTVYGVPRSVPVDTFQFGAQRIRTRVRMMVPRDEMSAAVDVLGAMSLAPAPQDMAGDPLLANLYDEESGV